MNCRCRTCRFYSWVRHTTSEGEAQQRGTAEFRTAKTQCLAASLPQTLVTIAPECTQKATILDKSFAAAGVPFNQFLNDFTTTRL
jgi:hypothetical protein